LKEDKPKDGEEVVDSALKSAAWARERLFNVGKDPNESIASEDVFKQAGIVGEKQVEDIQMSEVKDKIKSSEEKVDMAKAITFNPREQKIGQVSFAEKDDSFNEQLMNTQSIQGKDDSHRDLKRSMSMSSCSSERSALSVAEDEIEDMIENMDCLGDK